jgi:predicted CXXCH cytochrome family protein
MKSFLQAIATLGVAILLAPQPGDAVAAEQSCPSAISPSPASAGSTDCLACHDGVIARNTLPSPLGPSGFGDKSSHPVLVSYEQAHRRNPTAFVTPTALDPKIRLVDGKIQCTTCHVVSGTQGWATVTLAGRTDLCLGCHRR